MKNPDCPLDKSNGDGKKLGSSDKAGDEGGEEVGNDSGENKIAVVKLKMNSGYNTEKPPEDDCCPICFGEFRVPCKASCGHWFCGNCILQYWEYRSRPWQCKCPFCSSGISSLAADLSAVNKTEDEVVEVIKKIEQYNRFYVKGLEGRLLIFKFYALKLGPFLLQAPISTLAFTKRVLVDQLRHPERVDQNFRRVRPLVYFMTALIFVCLALYLPAHLRLGVFTIQFTDLTCGILVGVPCMAILCKRWIRLQWARFRLWKTRRKMAALRPYNTGLEADITVLPPDLQAFADNLVEYAVTAIAYAHLKAHAAGLRGPEAAEIIVNDAVAAIRAALL